MNRRWDRVRRVDPVWVFLLGFILLCALYEYGRVLNLPPLPMHIWRQGDCLSLTWHYYTGEADLLSPLIHSRIADGGESGKSAGEFPLLYWLIGHIWRITGPNEFVYRLFGLVLHGIASFFLFRTLQRVLRSDFWAVLLSLLLFTSPVLLYYGVSFLTDVPAFDLTLIGWYFIIRYWQERRPWTWMLGIMLFTLAMLLKVTAGMSLVAIAGIYVISIVLPRTAASFRTALPSIGLGMGSILFSVVSIMAWYVHAEHYNEIHYGRYTFNNLWPIWEMSAEELDRAFRYGREILVFQVFDTSIWLVILAALAILMVNVRELPAVAILLNGMLLVGVVLYTLFWFHAVDGHDYYFINPIIPLLILLVTWLWWLREHHPDLFQARWLRWAMVFLLTYNVAYARNNLIMRSNPMSQMDRDDLLPTYHCVEPGYWNALVDPKWKDMWDVAPFLDEIGVGAHDPVISMDDGTINTSLYFMRRPGFTRYGNDFSSATGIERCLSLGARFLVFSHREHLEEEHVKPYLKRPIGRRGSFRVFDLIDRPVSIDTLYHFQQIKGEVMTIDHRSDATSCDEGPGWCFPAKLYPFEIDGLALDGGGALSYLELEVKGSLQWEDGYAGGAVLALSENDRDMQVSQWNTELMEGAFEHSYRLAPIEQGTTRKLFIQNGSGRAFELDELELLVTRHSPIP